MQTSTPFKLGLAGLAALALAVLVIVLVGDDGVGGDVSPYEDDGDLDGGPRGRGERLTVDGGTNTRAPSLQGSGPVNRSLMPNLRTPSGIDLSDPAVRAEELTRLLQAPEVDWRAIARVLAIMEEPVPDELRGAFLHELRMGRRNQVMFAFAALNDPSFTEDLFDLLDDPEASRGAHAAALQALWRMPGADVDQVALRLESRLAQDFAQDREVLYAIAARGGTEATRALVQYVQALKNPASVPPYILKTLNVQDNPEAAAVVTDAISESRDPAVLGALLAMVSKPGASAYTQTIIDLDRTGQDESVRTRALAALGAIGDDKAIEYLIEKAAQPGAYGEKALQAIGRIRSADPAARAKLTKALESAEKSARPELAKESLILAIGSLKHEKAMPSVAHYLDDASSKVQTASVRALGRYGPAARPHVDRLIHLFEKGDTGMRLHVAIALGSIGGKDSIKAMEGWLEGEAGEEGLNPSLQRTLRMGLRAAKDAEERAAAGGK